MREPGAVRMFSRREFKAYLETPSENLVGNELKLIQTLYGLLLIMDTAFEIDPALQKLVESQAMGRILPKDQYEIPGT